MRPLSSLGIGLSLVFGCMLLALVAELYYLLRWKKRTANPDIEGDYTSVAKETFCLFSWKKPSSLSSTVLDPTAVRITDGSSDSQLHLHSNSSKDLLLKSFEGEEGWEAELMRLHNLSGPPRFLFTIKEETKEDLESEDGKSKGGRSRRGSRGRSLSDVLFPLETPFLTPLSSPPFFTPPVTPLDCYKQQGFNPLFESSKEDELNRMRSSPPPKFKFLKDAEEKLYRRTLMEEALRVHRNYGEAVANVAKPPASGVPPPSNPQQLAASPPPQGSEEEEEEEGSFISIIIGKNKEKGHQHQHHSSCSQVTPLSSSPSSIRPSHGKLIYHLSFKQ